MPDPALDAVLFDLDGVLTRTAAVHLEAWSDTFHDLLERRAPRTGEDLRPFSVEDYRAHVDGRPRLDGIRAFLRARGISLPEGEATDPPGAGTVQALGRRKNERFRVLLDERGVDLDDAAAPLLRALRAAGVRVGVCTSSRNGAAVLRRAGLDRFLDARVDGLLGEELALRGKPAPDAFLLCARRLHARPLHSVVVEDAALGVEAGRRGGFGLVVGIDATGNNAERLEEAGADWVVRDLGELSPETLRERLAAATSMPRGPLEAPAGGAP